MGLSSVRGELKVIAIVFSSCNNSWLKKGFTITCPTMYLHVFIVYALSMQQDEILCKLKMHHNNN